MKKRNQFLSNLTDAEAANLEYRWSWWARPKQIAPAGEWATWLLLAGRGFGKTRTGAEWVRHQVESCGKRRVALVAATAADARDVMVEGESGLLEVCPPWNRPKYEPSKRRLTWPNGALATTYSADEPKRLRGPSHDCAWADELAAWRYEEAWDNLMLGLRLGTDPRAVVTTTPKPNKLVKDLVAEEGTVIVKGTTYENRQNLAERFFDKIIRRYEGTRLGRQELDAELLDDRPGALWNSVMLEDLRVKQHPELVRIVGAIDPAISNNEGSDEHGIIFGGKAAGKDGHCYILADLSMRGTPSEWATCAINGFKRWNADKLLAETNQGGDMVEHTIRTVDASIPFKQVRAFRSKVLRAEPIAALYEQGRIHHVGMFGQLEDQMCDFTTDFNKAAAGYSPDRVDALVYVVTELMTGATFRWDQLI